MMFLILTSEKNKMSKIKIVGVFILVLVLLIVGLGFYKFNFTDDDIYFSGASIQPESYKVFQGSWILENSEFKEGFTLNEDSTAFSISMASLLYKKWKIEDNNLVLTAISFGNQIASLSDEKYAIKSFNHNRMLLEKNGVEYSYKRANETIKTDISYITSLSTSFEYFPADYIEVTKVPAKKHPIDFNSNPRAPHFKTAISQDYSEKSANFGAYYIISVWGCGTGCLEGVMIDTRDGKIYNLPTKKGYSDIGGDIENYSNSILLKTFTFQPIDATSREVEISSWLWNESAKEFVNYTTSNEIIKE